MKILLVNKFLYQKGGAETYVIKLGNFFKLQGHEVQYFGMKNSKNILKNDYNLYVSEKDFSTRTFKNIFQVKSMINNKEAKKKMIRLLNVYEPNLVILNNIEYHLTPSIIDAIRIYKKKNKKIKVFYVAHDYQLVCPSHGLFDNNINPCEKCLNGKYINCFKSKCMKNSRIKSLIAMLDSFYWHKRKTYNYVDKIICPSYFMKSKLDTCDLFKNKTIVIHNYVDKKIETNNYEKKDYIIYFGKLCKDKGVETLIEVAKELKNIKFVFAGYGPLENKIRKITNAEFVGFKSGKELESLIAEAKISICPSEWYENCPFSVIESIMCGTPVIGSNMGGIPELINEGINGEIFEAKNKAELKNKILMLWNDKQKLERYSKNCKNNKVVTIKNYAEKLISLYKNI